MLRKNILSALILCAILNTSCEKEETIVPSGVGESTNPLSSVTDPAMRLGDFVSTTNVDNPATHKGLYIDGAQNIIGNTTKENNLITYAVNKGINSFAFYGLKNVISSSANYSKV